jgi:AraC-like DNA-binding protein
MPNAQRSAWSTADVRATDAVDYWTDVIRNTLVPVTVRPGPSPAFEGRVEHATVDGVGFSVLSAGGQQVERTRGLIARSHEDFVLANIQIQGRAQVSQDGRTASLSAGAMTFVDSTRPYSLRFDDTFAQLVVQFPRSLVAGHALTAATATELNSTGPGRLVADFLVGLEQQLRVDPEAAAMLIPHATGLVDCALGLATRSRVSTASGDALTRERIRRFVRGHACDPDLDAAAVAAACGISRRTLFRAMSTDGESFTTLLRRLRVIRAKQVIRATPTRSLATVAHECGFGGQAQLHRAFRAVTGTTPAAYRSGSTTATGGTDRQ